MVVCRSAKSWAYQSRLWRRSRARAPRAVRRGARGHRRSAAARRTRGRRSSCIRAGRAVGVLGGVVVAVVVALALLGAQAHADAVGEALAGAGGIALGVVRPAACLERERGLVGRARDHVDHAAHRLVAEQHAGTALQDLDALDVLDRDAVEVRARERGIVEAPAIDQHQRVVGRVLAEAAHAHDHAASAVADGVADLQAGAPAQRLGHGQRAAPLDVLARDHAHRRGAVQRRLLGAHAAHDDLFDAVGRIGVQGACAAQQREGNQSTGNAHGPSPIHGVMETRRGDEGRERRSGQDADYRRARRSIAVNHGWPVSGLVSGPRGSGRRLPIRRVRCLRQWLCAGPCSLTVAGAALGLHQTSCFIQRRRRLVARRRWTPSATGAATYPLPRSSSTLVGPHSCGHRSWVRIHSDTCPAEAGPTKSRTHEGRTHEGRTHGRGLIRRAGGRGLRRLPRSGGRRRSSWRWARCGRVRGG